MVIESNDFVAKLKYIRLFHSSKIQFCNTPNSGLYLLGLFIHVFTLFAVFLSIAVVIPVNTCFGGLRVCYKFNKSL